MLLFLFVSKWKYLGHLSSVKADIPSFYRTYIMSYTSYYFSVFVLSLIQSL